MKSDWKRDIEARLDWLEQVVAAMSSGLGMSDVPRRPDAADHSAPPGDTTRSSFWPPVVGGTPCAADPAEGLPQDVLALIDADRTIDAIKAYREATGAGLADAKRAVEKLQADRRG